MLLLTHHPDLVATVLGEVCMERLIFPTIVKDGTDMVRPMVLAKEDKPVAVFLPEVEQAALASPPAAPVILYGYYFTWNTRPRASLVTCVERETDGAPFSLDARAPAALYQNLSSALNVTLSSMPDLPRLEATSLSRKEVEAAWAADEARIRDAARQAAEKLAAPYIEAVFDYQKPDRFVLLSHILDRARLDGVLVTSPIHAQALSGLPLAEIVRCGTTALYLRGSDDVILLNWQGDYGPGRRMGQFTDLVDAVSHFATGPVGYEDVHLAAGIVQTLHDGPVDTHPASSLLRQWETRMAGANAPAFLIAAMATAQAIEYAIAEAEEERRQGHTITERDLDSAYRETVMRIAASLGIPGLIQPYFNIIQAGERTLYPAVPTSFAFTDRTHTVKFDMGVQVVDSHGLTRGCSDIARTWTLSREASAMAEVLTRVLRDGLPRPLRPGATGADMYRGGIASLGEHDGTFRKLGYLASGKTVAGYNRDCGHALGRQTPSSIHFLPDDHGVIEEGMIACLELVWPVRSNVFAHEDMWFVTADRPVNITRHTGWLWD